MLQELNDYNWAEVFGEGSGGNCTAIIPNTPPGIEVDGKTFSREDVVEISEMVEGEHDGPDWVVYGRLADGRWFVARGGCDYTGWDCRAGNGGDVANTKDEIIRYGLTQEERERFSIVLAPITA